jgi:hypothetical protein
VEQPPDLTPALTVILPAMLGYESVAAALDAWDAQTSRHRIEVLVLCPTAPKETCRDDHVIVETGSLRLHEARALGVRTAAAGAIVLAEDHCLPDPEYAEHVLARLEEGWDAVGPAIRSGAARGAVPQGSFLIGYGQWVLPAAGPTAHLPGHNPAIRKAVLLELGADLDVALFEAMFLMRRLQREGRRFFVEPNARMRHFDPPNLSRAARIFLVVGQGCGAMRLRGRSAAARAGYVLLTPVTALRHFARAAVHYARVGRRAGLVPLSVLTSMIFAGIWAVGESAGALLGIARVAPYLWLSEVKPVSRDEARR